MVSLTCFNRRFTPKWTMTLLALLAMLTFSRLGYWQLERAEEKKQILKAEAKFAKEPPSIWTAEMTMPRQYQRITVEGSYLPQFFLLDNQHHQHQFGFHVFSPLVLNSGEVVLIDRGWVAGDVTRQTWPKLSIPKGSLRLTGSAYYASNKNWLLGPSYEQKGKNLTIIEGIDTKLVGQFLHKSIYPFIIRLNKNEAQGYVREWAVVSMPAERHYAYALQWFALACVILILFIALNLKKNYDKS